MVINPSLSGENIGVIEPVMADSYSRNAGLVLDADLTQMLRPKLAGSRLCWNAKLLNFAFELKHEVHVGRLPCLTKDARSASGDLRV